MPGVKKAALGYYRAMFGMLRDAAKESRRLLESKVAVPTLALTGALDSCMDTRLHDFAMRGPTTSRIECGSSVSTAPVTSSTRRSRRR